MSCIHDNETILAKKAKLVKMQKYVKKNPKNIKMQNYVKKNPKQSPLCSTIHCYCNYIDIQLSFHWKLEYVSNCFMYSITASYRNWNCSYKRENNTKCWFDFSRFAKLLGEQNTNNNGTQFVLFTAMLEFNSIGHMIFFLSIVSIFLGYLCI